MIRMIDIAKKTGVSRTTVSFVLNGRHKKDMKISDAVVRLVEKAAEEMGYVRDEIAHAVVTGKSRDIALISSFTDYAMISARAFMEEAQEHDCSVKLISLKDGINAAIRKAMGYRVCGIYASIHRKVQAEIDPKYLQLDIPSIGLQLGTGRMAFNQTESAKVGTEYLIAKGHKKILFWGFNDTIGLEREQGYLEAMKKHGLKPDVMRIDNMDSTPLTPKVFDHILKKKPEAIQCFSDYLAFKIMRECYRRRLFIPDVFSLLGFGNTPASKGSAPLLATIDEPYTETGKIMFRQIHELINSGKSKEPTPLIGELISGETIADKTHKI